LIVAVGVRRIAPRINKPFFHIAERRVLFCQARHVATKAYWSVLFKADL
jgi:hypothetical protein